VAVNGNVWKPVAFTALGAVATVAVMSFTVGRSVVTKDDLNAAVVELKAADEEQAKGVETLNDVTDRLQLLLQTHGITWENLERAQP